jgi:hypothetical protein
MKGIDTMEIKVISKTPDRWVRDNFFEDGDERAEVIDFPICEKGYGDLMYHRWADFCPGDARLNTFWHLTKKLFDELDLLLGNTGTDFSVELVIINDQWHYPDW